MTINTTIPTQEETKRRARRLRRRQTKAEQMLWDVLRAKRLCGLKFRRQHPIDPFIADFACVARKAIVELDGGYRDYQYEDDDSRKAFLEEQGWFVMRFSNDEVIENIDAVAVSIAKQLELVPKFGERRTREFWDDVRRETLSRSYSPTSPTSGRGERNTKT